MWFSVSAYSPQKGYFVAVFDVITERKNYEAALREEINVRSHFINLLAHEIKNPLSPVLTSSTILADLLKDHPDQRLSRLADNTLSGARILSERMEELLDFARFNKGSITLDKKPTAVADYLTTIIDRYRPVIDQSRHVLRITIPSDLPAVWLDRSRIEQVLLNLLSNAMKYTPKGGRISIVLKDKSATHEGTSLRFCDNGIGIPEEKQKELFTAAVIESTPGTENEKGTGFGLKLCHELVKINGGTMTVESREGEGTCFTLTLPDSSMQNGG